MMKGINVYLYLTMVCACSVDAEAQVGKVEVMNDAATLKNNLNNAL